VACVAEYRKAPVDEPLRIIFGERRAEDDALIDGVEDDVARDPAPRER
jgi:hypothetical protein